MTERKKRTTADAKVAEAWRTISETPHGKLALAELFLSLNMYSEIQASDPITAGIAIGERNVGARIASWIGRKPETFMIEAQDDVDEIEGLSNAMMNMERYQ